MPFLEAGTWGVPVLYVLQVLQEGFCLDDYGIKVIYIRQVAACVVLAQKLSETWRVHVHALHGSADGRALLI